MDAAGAVESVLEEVQCPVCLEYFTAPIILPCSHVLCRSPCAERLFNNNIIRCPVCRDNSYVSGGVENLPRVFTLENIIRTCQSANSEGGDQPDADELLACRLGEIPCQMCAGTPRRGVRSCLNCRATYCQSCLQISHPDNDPFNQHRLVEPLGKPRVQEFPCSDHQALLVLFCRDCHMACCIKCKDDEEVHQGHEFISLSEATQQIKITLKRDVLGQLEEKILNLSAAMQQRRRHLQDLQNEAASQRDELNAECDGLVSEVERKRNFFLADLEYEEKRHTSPILQQLTLLQASYDDVYPMASDIRDVLKQTANPVEFLQEVKQLKERGRKILFGPEKVDECPEASDVTGLQHRVVDLREEKAVLRNISYLTVPGRPVIELSRCCRSMHSVVLVLQPPQQEDCQPEAYEVHHKCQDSRRPPHEDINKFGTPREMCRFGPGCPSNADTVCLLHKTLQCNTRYEFSVRATNSAGHSDISWPYSCTTLTEEQQHGIRAPEICIIKCRTYTRSIQLHIPDIEGLGTLQPEVEYRLLYRRQEPMGEHRIWHCVVLFCRPDHGVFGLLSDNFYEFAVVAFDRDRGCQISNIVPLKTESAN